MANEISYNGSLKCAKGEFLTSRSHGDTATQTGTGSAGMTQTIGFSAHEALIVTDLSTPGWAWFKNLDSTNYVEIGTDVAAAFVPFAKMLPGETAGPFRLATAAPYAKANTAAVKLQYEILET